MKHANYLLLAAIALVQSRAFGSGPTLPVNIDPSTQALSPISLELNEDIAVRSLVVDSRIFIPGKSPLEASTGEVIPLEQGFERGVVDFGDDFLDLENPQRVSLEPGVYCEQLTVTALVDGYDATFQFARFYYFEVVEDAIRVVPESEYASHALTLQPIFNATNELVLGSAGQGQPASDADLRLPVGEAAPVESGDSGLGATDVSERNEK